MHISMSVHFPGEIGLRVLSYSQRGLGPSVIKLPGGWQDKVAALGVSGLGLAWSALVLWELGPVINAPQPPFSFPICKRTELSKVVSEVPFNSKIQ